jgi:hypothetical protein
MFNANELEEGANQLVDPSVGIWDVLVIMQAMLGLFTLVVPTIVNHAQSTGGHYNLVAPFKLDFDFKS